MKEFITYKDKTITFSEFDNLVNSLIMKFNKFEQLDDFIIIKEDNPIQFYTLLFALWQCNKKVVFPNRDFFEGESFEFVKYIIDIDEIYTNKEYKKIDGIVGDTVLFSSGSTGKPKGIVHKKESFFQNAQEVLSRLNINKITSITPLKPYLVSALSHFLVHKLSSSHLIFVEADQLSTVKDISAKYEKLSYVGSPMHILSMMPYMSNQNPELFFSSGDIFYLSALEEIFNKYPKTTFFNVYGMAELAGRLFINKITSNTDKSQYKSIGKNLDIMDVKFQDDEVYVKSAILFDGYIKDNIYYKQETEYFASGDKVINKNNIYEFYGRSNDEIKIAGNKVSLKYIEQLISTVLDDNITPIIVSEKHKLFGNLIVLVVYTADNVYVSKTELIKILKKQLKNYELPHRIYKIDTIPYTQTMKIDRNIIVNNLNKLQIL